jgi:hypothetical protein
MPEHVTTSAPAVRPEEVELYIKGKAAYQEVFPWLYATVRDGVLASVRPTWPDIGVIVGTTAEGIVKSIAHHPLLGEKVPLEWVAFSFDSIDLFDYHIGWVLDMDHYPIKYILGLHIMDHVLPQYEAAVRTIDWRKLGLPGEYAYFPAIHEHRWMDPMGELDLTDLAKTASHVVDRMTRYYLASAPVAHSQKAG